VLGAENGVEFVPVSAAVASFVQVELTRAQATYGNLPAEFPTPYAIFVSPERLGGTSEARSESRQAGLWK
jgi:hypothetical protein